MKDLELKLPAETKDEYGFTPSENKEIEKQFTRPSAPPGTWKNFVAANELAEKEHLKKLTTHSVENSSVPVSKAAQGSNQHKADVMDYINKKIETYEGGGVKIDPPILRENINKKRYVNKSLNKFENRTDDPNTVTFNPTTQLFTNKDRTIAFKDYNSADNYNKSLGTKPKYPTEATPKQFGELAERLERDRQMRGAPTDLKEFGHRFNENRKEPQYPGMKAWQKKKKISTPIEPVKMKLDPYTPFVPIHRPEKDPEMIARERRFNQMQDEMNREKWKRNNTGVAGLLGGAPKYYGK